MSVPHARVGRRCVVAYGARARERVVSTRDRGRARRAASPVGAARQRLALRDGCAGAMRRRGSHGLPAQAHSAAACQRRVAPQAALQRVDSCGPLAAGRSLARAPSIGTTADAQVTCAHGAAIPARSTAMGSARRPPSYSAGGAAASRHGHAAAGVAAVATAWRCVVWGAQPRRQSLQVCRQVCMQRRVVVAMRRVASTTATSASTATDVNGHSAIPWRHPPNGGVRRHVRGPRRRARARSCREWRRRRATAALRQAARRGPAGAHANLAAGRLHHGGGREPDIHRGGVNRARARALCSALRSGHGRFRYRGAPCCRQTQWQRWDPWPVPRERRAALSPTRRYVMSSRCAYTALRWRCGARGSCVLPAT